MSKPHPDVEDQRHATQNPPGYKAVSSDQPTNKYFEAEDAASLSSEEEQDSIQDQAKSAFYDYASEKSISLEESKLFYQRHRPEPHQHDPAVHGRINRSRTFSLNYDGGWGHYRSGRRQKHYTRNDTRDRRRLPEYEEPLSRPRLSESQGSRDTINEDGREEQHAALAVDNLASIPDAHNIEGPSSKTLVADSNIRPELHEMSLRIKEVLDLRNKYIELSLQGPHDNPKDDPDWEVYPEPPKPVWIDEREGLQTLDSGTQSLNSSKARISDSDSPFNRPRKSSASTIDEPTHVRPASPPKQQRKPGQNIGEDFEMSHFEPLPGEDVVFSFKLDEGSVYQVYQGAEALNRTRSWIHVPTLREYYIDLNTVKEVSEDGPIKSFAFRELQILDGKFNLHTLENSYAEVMESKNVPHRDFYNVRKVDTHVHHSASMNSKHLLRFIKSKLKKSPNDIVMFRDGKELSLSEVFESLNMRAYDLSIDTLDTHVCNSSND